MIIANETKKRRIEFVKIESVKEHYRSHHVQIKIETENIKADFDNFIWISDADIDKFLVELVVLDESRRGQALLGSMEPGEMALGFQSIDTSGHISAAFHFVKKDRNRKYSYEVKVEFEIDPMSLVGVRSQVLKLME